MKCLKHIFARNANGEAVKAIVRGFILVALFSSAIFATSCSRYCARKYPVQVITVDSSRVTTEIRYKDTTLYIQIPGKTVRDSIPVVIQIPGQPLQITPNKIHQELEYCEATAEIKGLKMFLSLSQKDTVISRVIKNALQSVITSERFWRNETIRIVEENKAAVKEATKKGRLQGGLFLLLLQCVLIGGYFYVKSKL